MQGRDFKVIKPGEGKWRQIPPDQSQEEAITLGGVIQGYNIHYPVRYSLLRNWQHFRAASKAHKELLSLSKRARVLNIHSKSPNWAEWIGTLCTIWIGVMTCALNTRGVMT